MGRIIDKEHLQRYHSGIEGSLMAASEKVKLANEPEIYIGTCSTTAATQAKTATITGLTQLTAGQLFIILFTTGQTYNGVPTLNLNSLGAKNIQRVSGTNAGRYEWSANELLMMYYNGTAFVLLDSGLATTTYYGLTKLSSSFTSTSTELAATPSTVNALGKDLGPVETSTTASRAYSVGELFMYSGQLYEVTTAIASGGTITVGTNCSAVTAAEKLYLLKAYNERIHAANEAAMDNFLHIRANEQRLETVESNNSVYSKELKPETQTVTLTNTSKYPFNNSKKTVSLSTARSYLTYTVEVEVTSSDINIGDIHITEKQLNGFKIAYDGSASSATVKLTIKGGFLA